WFLRHDLLFLKLFCATGPLRRLLALDGFSDRDRPAPDEHSGCHRARLRHEIPLHRSAERATRSRPAPPRENRWPASVPNREVARDSRPRAENRQIDSAAKRPPIL